MNDPTQSQAPAPAEEVLFPIDRPEFDTAAPDPSKEVEKEAEFDMRWQDGRQPPRQCSAHRTNGEPCRRAAINGGNVCGTHGGRSPQVKAKARVRLEMAADRVAKELLHIATDDASPPAVKLAAIKDALDRAGVSAKTTVEVEPGARFQEVLDVVLAGGPRGAAGKAGDPDREWIAQELNIINAEVVDDGPAHPAPPRPEAAQLEAPAPPPNGSGLLSMEDALEQLHATNPPPAPPAARRRRGRS
ncbi:hypothetical protein [Williamsia deligens]|uniref:Uncharacterized protein n=1 Tax=Williamsia deligens TaxID=321325 RepID=A0ABW3G920_9NOCA|nr:hypothetical protein [Williamsia deligens]MCP2192667.1 hypothetical protein [Williamsia deligens]